METKNIKVITQVTLSQEQREKADNIANFSQEVNKQLEDKFDIIKDIKFSTYKGQKISKYNSNKSISLLYNMKMKYKEAGVSISDAVRYLLDNNYLK